MASNILKHAACRTAGRIYKKCCQRNSSVLAGSTFQQTQAEGQTIQATGYTSDALIENILAAEATNVIGANFYRYRYVALFCRIHYNYRDKYLINVTARRDGSSRFGPDHQYGDFGSVECSMDIFKGKILQQQPNKFWKIKIQLWLNRKRCYQQLPVSEYLFANYLLLQWK